MKTIYLIRHGMVNNPDKIFYPPDAPLSETGAGEIRALGRDLLADGCKPTRIVSSPYRRAAESAQAIAKELQGPEVELDDRLVEWQVGDWIGKPLAEFRSYVGYDREPFEPDTDGFEDFPTMATRTRTAIEDVVARLPDGACAVVVSHREPMVSAILTFQGKGFEEVPHLVFHKGAAWKLRFNDTTFIEAKSAFDRSSEDSKHTP